MTKRLTVALTALAVLATSGTAVADDELHDQRGGAARRVERAEQQVGESSRRLRTANRRRQDALARLRNARAELAEMDGRVVAARERDRALRADLGDAELRLSEARAASAAAAAGVADQKQLVVDTVVGVYEGEDRGLLALNSLLAAASTEDLTRRQAAAEALVVKQARAYDAFRATRVLAEVGERQVEELALDVAARQEAAAASLQDLEGARRQARSVAGDVQVLLRERRRSQASARRVRDRDLAILRAAEAKEARLRERIKEAARRQAALATQDRGTTADGFLSLPVAGSVSSPFGYRVHPIFKYWGLHDGIDYAAGCGQPLRAGADGVVTSKYYSDVYGYRLFVNVGATTRGGVTLVYNHADGYSVEVGDRVDRGQVIGAVGDTGWSTGCHLHFTVLADGSPVDPEGWY